MWIHKHIHIYTDMCVYIYIYMYTQLWYLHRSTLYPIISYS